MKKKLSVISLILAAALTLSACGSANELQSDAIASIAESAAQSAVESALAELETDDTAKSAGTGETDAADELKNDEDDIPERGFSFTVKGETAEDTTPEELPEDNDTGSITAADTTAPAETTAVTTKATTTVQTTAPEQSVEDSKTSKGPSSPKRDITNESMLLITNMKVSISKDGTGQAFPVLYNFNKKLSTGFVSGGSGFPNEMIPLETDSYGIIGEVTGKYKVKLRVYNNTGENATMKSSYIENATFMEGKWFENKLALNKDVTLDLSTLPEVKEYSRCWVVRASIKTEDSTVNVWTFIFTNVDETWLCAKAEKTYSDYVFKKRRADREELMERFRTDKIDPKNELAVLGFMHYPRPDFDKPEKNKDETQDWVNLVKSIDVSGMSDERKVWTAYEWINNNIAYDYWEYINCHNPETGKNIGRARYFKDWSGKYDTYQLRCGVCWDMANLMVLFCRTWGIPAVVLSGSTHAWCAVYLNDRWIEFDCTQTNRYAVNTEDATERTKESRIYYGYLRDIGRLNTNPLEEVNESLACCPGWSDLSKSFSA